MKHWIELTYFVGLLPNALVLLGLACEGDRQKRKEEQVGKIGCLIAAVGLGAFWPIIWVIGGVIWLYARGVHIKLNQTLREKEVELLKALKH